MNRIIYRIYDDITFLLWIDDNPNTYCEHCFEQRLSNKISDSKQHRVIIEKDALKISNDFMNQYGIINVSNLSFDKIDIFPVPGCEGEKHGYTNN